MSLETVWVVRVWSVELVEVRLRGVTMSGLGKDNRKWLFRDIVRFANAN